MFYSQIILARKGPLGKIWLAAHFDKKLTKNQIFSTDISDSVQSILNTPNPLALRVSGHLMLGIVRIYGRKIKYLCNDCNESLWKIKLAFRSGAVNLLESQLALSNQIDDQRFFGHINPDIDFPELADEGFAEALLTNDATLKAARNRSLTSQEDLLRDQFGARLTENFQETSLSKIDRDSSFSRDSNLSSVEKVRKASLAEPRISNVIKSHTPLFNDETIPAFEDNYEMDFQFPQDDAYAYEETSYNAAAGMDLPELPLPLLPLTESLDDLPLPNDVSNSGIPTNETIPTPVTAPVPPKKRNTMAVKRRKLTIDRQVELSSKDCKRVSISYSYSYSLW